MFISHYRYTTDSLKHSIPIIKPYLIFPNIWSKEVPVNISYPGTANQMYGYLDASISPIYVKLYYIKG